MGLPARDAPALLVSPTTPEPAMTPAAAAPATQEATPELIATVTSALDASPYFEANGFRVEAQQGAVRLHGQVGTFFEKQMVQEVVRRLDGVERIENHIEVSWR